MSEANISRLVDQLIAATNAFDVEAAMALFASDAVIDDVSVGEKFEAVAGVPEYLEDFFVGYQTVTRLVSLVVADDRHAKAQVDFTGNFGHETGALELTLNADGLIAAIAAYLD